MVLLESIQMPERIIKEKETYTDKYGKFYIGPMEPGFGTTIGNTLRRVLLSSIQGSAIRCVRVKGLYHQYCSIPGAKQDYVDLILNLKNVVLILDTNEEVKLELHHKGIGKVTAGEFQETSNAKIVNKDLFLLEMTEDIDLHFEVWAGIGRGYVREDNQNIDDKPEDVIPIDSIYSPIRKVNFYVEKERVQEKIGYDRLVIEILTDGSITPENSLYLSAKILRDYYDRMVKFEKEPEYIEEEAIDPELLKMEKLLNMKVEELEISVRVTNCLAAGMIKTIGELVAKSEAEMIKYRNLGTKSLNDIKNLLEKYDLGLGMNVKEIFNKIRESKMKRLKEEHKELEEGK
ncbi:MAG: DNA-directed RNA polymerase subunit alpha [Candidatus Cloacimonadota bacterium]|nr:MAG: DNA-directed RNA polymerase subunit alpha [Candidatus Cloacimonadota bacterium]